jgi:ATP-binding cassette, subfamily B, bacterial
VSAAPEPASVPADRDAADRGTGRRVWGLFTPYRREMLVIAGVILVTAGLGVVPPFLTQAVFDRALFPVDGGGVDVGLLLWLVAGLVVIPMAAALVGVGQTYLTTRLGQRVMADLRSRLFAHLQRMELAFFTATRTGSIQSRLANDAGGVSNVLSTTASSILSNSVTVLAALVAMLLLSWQLTLVAVALLPLFVLLQVRVGRVRQRIARRTQESLSEMTAITQESLSVSGVLLAKVFHRQASEVERYRAENGRQIGLQVRQAMTGQWFFAVVQAFLGITPALVYLLAGLILVLDGTITAGTLVAFTTLQARLLFPTVQLLQVSLDVQTSFALFRRIFEYLDLTPSIVDAPAARPLPAAVRGEVRFEGVWFRYPTDAGLPASAGGPDVGGPAPAGDPTTASGPAPAWALEDLSLTIGPGRLCAVVGPSGSGKTTLSYLVPRLYDVTRGRVLVDGHDVRDLTVSSLAGAIGMVTQDTYLFHATVLDNLRYARADATREEIEEAARGANIHDRILGFEHGYDTVVGERGYRLSGGEKQRLAIARVLLKDPRILVLDEATSALDTVSERLVQEALERATTRRTTIAIAHRLSTVLNADVICVVDAGRLVETGTHAELLARDGLYARLYAEQFGAGRVQARCADGTLFADGSVVRHLPHGVPAAGAA